MRFVVAVLALSVAALVPASAVAQDTTAATTPAKARKHAKAEKKGIPADRFRQEIDARIARARDRLEHHIEKKRMSEPSAGAMRTEFNAVVLSVRAKVAAVAKDGVVSRDEAREVRALVRQIRSHKR